MIETGIDLVDPVLMIALAVGGTAQELKKKTVSGGTGDDVGEGNPAETLRKQIGIRSSSAGEIEPSVRVLTGMAGSAFLHQHRDDIPAEGRRSVYGTHEVRGRTKRLR